MRPSFVRKRFPSMSPSPNHIASWSVVVHPVVMNNRKFYKLEIARANLFPNHDGRLLADLAVDLSNSSLPVRPVGDRRQGGRTMKYMLMIH
jgi:hypothetical protein